MRFASHCPAGFWLCLEGFEDFDVKKLTRIVACNNTQKYPGECHTAFIPLIRKNTQAGIREGALMSKPTLPNRKVELKNGKALHYRNLSHRTARHN